MRFDPLRPRSEDLPPATGTFVDEEVRRRDRLFWLVLGAVAAFGALLWWLALR